MPTYDYQCEANDQVIEVHHKMSIRLKTWAELCAFAGIETGSTPTDATMTWLISGGSYNCSSEVITLENILPN